MSPYKLQLGCFMITLYIAVTYLRNQTGRKKEKHTRIFEMMLAAVMVYLLLDVSTVYGVNHLDRINPVLNLVLHLLYLISVDTVLLLIFHYLFALCGDLFKNRRVMLLVNIPFVISVILAVATIGRLVYMHGAETNYATGLPAYSCYFMGFTYFLFGIGILFRRWRYLEKKKAQVLRFCLVVSMGLLFAQVIFPEILIAGLAFTLVVLGAYVHVENNSAEELEHIHEETIHSFADLVESRDGSTGEHIKRTTVYVRIIAGALLEYGQFQRVLTKDYINCLAQAAPMHDIGKIAVPDAVLQKPGKLTTEEFEQMKTHTTTGAELIQKSFNLHQNDEYIDMCYHVALSHHEKWNGRGYPQGLKGEEIPLCARIMAVADVFDAVSQNRCYRKAMTLDESFAIIEQGIGTDFDPGIAECFLRVRPQIERAYMSFNRGEA